MALQVWLPMNNDSTGIFENKGLSPNELMMVDGTIYTSTDGKIGKCCRFTQDEDNCVYGDNSPLNNNTEEFSICCWVRKKNEAGGCLFTNRTTITDQAISIFLESTILFDDGVRWSFTPSINVTVNQWVHVCFTRKKGVGKKFYVNGVLSDSTTITGTPVYANSDWWMIGAKQSSPESCGGDYLIADLNDFRIYDHCLSDKEVKEIAKGLVVHYPLNNQYEQSILNRYSGENATGLASSASGFTVTKLTNERGYNYKLSTYGNGSSRWYWIEFPSFSFTVGKTYYYSVKVRINSDNLGMQLRAARCSNDWVTNIVGIQTTIHDWKEYVVHVVMPESFDRRGETVIVESPRLEFCTNDVTVDGKLYEMDFDIKDVQVVESDTYVPFIMNDLISTTVSDNSGFNNDGSENGSFSINPDSVKYNNCIVFNGSDNWITVPFNNAVGSSPKELTINVWFYKTSIGTKNYQSIFAGPGFELEARNNAETDPVLVLWNWGKGTTPYEFNRWNMVTFVWTPTQVKLYLNGELKLTADNSQALLTGNYYISGWLRTQTNVVEQQFEGKMSDFRLYSTALSDEDIKELYNTSASITSNGSLMCLEFVEET